MNWSEDDSNSNNSNNKIIKNSNSAHSFIPFRFIFFCRHRIKVKKREKNLFLLFKLSMIFFPILFKEKVQQQSMNLLKCQILNEMSKWIFIWCRGMRLRNAGRGEMSVTGKRNKWEKLNKLKWFFISCILYFSLFLKISIWNFSVCNTRLERKLSFIFTCFFFPLLGDIYMFWLEICILHALCDVKKCPSHSYSEITWKNLFIYQTVYAHLSLLGLKPRCKILSVDVAKPSRISTMKSLFNSESNFQFYFNERFQMRKIRFKRIHSYSHKNHKILILMSNLNTSFSKLTKILWFYLILFFIFQI